MRTAFALLTLLGLAACGADGEPIRPTASSTITMSSSGVSVGSTLGLRRGPLSVTLGL